jgi:hypothetical protein
MRVGGVRNALPVMPRNKRAAVSEVNPRKEVYL